MTIHEHLMQTRAICDAATKEPWTVSVEECEEHGCECGDISIPEIERSFHSCEWADAADWERDKANAKFCAHARTALPRFTKALEVAVMGIDGEIGAASCCGRTTQYARLHRLRAEIQAALEGR